MNTVPSRIELVVTGQAQHETLCVRMVRPGCKCRKWQWRNVNLADFKNGIRTTQMLRRGCESLDALSSSSGWCRKFAPRHCGAPRQGDHEKAAELRDQAAAALASGDAAGDPAAALLPLKRGSARKCCARRSLRRAHSHASRARLPLPPLASSILFEHTQLALMNYHKRQVLCFGNPESCGIGGP